MPARTLALFAALFAINASAGAQQVIPLWQAGAPGFESRRDEPEQHQDWWYKNIHNPSLTVFLPPAGRNSGTAVIVAVPASRAMTRTIAPIAARLIANAIA